MWVSVFECVNKGAAITVLFFPPELSPDLLSISCRIFISIMAEYFVTCLSFSLPVFLSVLPYPFFLFLSTLAFSYSLRSHLTFCLHKKWVIRPNPAVPLSPRVPITHPLLLLSASFHFLPFLLPPLCLCFSFLLSYAIHWSFFPQEVTSKAPEKRKPLLWHYMRETSLLIPPPACILYLSEWKKSEYH